MTSSTHKNSFTSNKDLIDITLFGLIMQGTGWKIEHAEWQRNILKELTQDQKVLILNTVEKWGAKPDTKFLGLGLMTSSGMVDAVIELEDPDRGILTDIVEL